VIETQPAVTST